MRILGIDPGSHTIGHGTIEIKKGINSCISYGVLRIKEKDTGAQLVRIKLEVDKIIKKNKPDIISIEKLFFYKNSKTVMTVSESRGVILYTVAKNKLPFQEFTPLQVKQMVSGYGRAEKTNIKKMIKLLLNLSEEPSSDDAADALALALCCSYSL